jgi:hypothetical protein
VSDELRPDGGPFIRIVKCDIIAVAGITASVTGWNGMVGFTTPILEAYGLNDLNSVTM